MDTVLIKYILNFLYQDNKYILNFLYQDNKILDKIFLSGFSFRHIYYIQKTCKR